MTARTRRPDSRVLIVGLLFPVALVAVALGVVLAWMPELPTTVAVHWGLHGADGYGPRWTLPLLLGVLGLGLPLLLGGIAVGSTRTAPGWAAKLLTVVSSGIGVLLSVAFTAAVGVQRGLETAREAPDILPFMAIGFGSALIVAVVAWFLLPKAVRSHAALTPVAPLALAADERAVWLGTARFPLPVIAAIVLPTLGVAAFASSAAAAQGGVAVALLLIPILVILLTLASADWRVRVDATGLGVRSILGLPRWTIPLADIETAGTTTVVALAEFGGWGVRWSGMGRIGVITRSGQALEVRRRDGRSLVITVDDADAAAALLTARIAARR